MARITRTVPVSSQRRETLSITCDLCGAEAPNPGSSMDAAWGKDDYEVAHTVVTLERGTQSWDYNSWEKLSFDICPTCFLTKLAVLFPVEPQRMKSEW